MQGVEADVLGVALNAMQAELDANASSLDEITRVLRRLPYSPAEIRFATEVVTQWQQIGRDVAVAPLDPDYHQHSLEQRTAMRIAWAKEGIMFVSSGDLGVQMLMVKVDNGRGLLGRQKTHYACFASMDMRTYQPVGTTSVQTMALTKLGALYRV